MLKLNLDFGDRSYPIVIGQDVTKSGIVDALSAKCERVAIISNTTVAPLYAEKIKALFHQYEISVLELPDGEKYKNLNTLNDIFDFLLENKFDRSTTLVALGGGVVGDITGFAAASYQRGIDFIQIPTTLLSQVDSSVGGKTGINHRLGKNMIGAFYQPKFVLIDPSTLDTLPDRELVAGIAEVIKYGLIYDLEFANWLDANLDLLLQRDLDALTHAIYRSCEIKAEVVQQDEKESGIRAILNLGHTFGHAFETALGYGEWLHGEAIGLGMILAMQLSVRLELMDSASIAPMVSLIERTGLPTKLPRELDVDELLALMTSDKKAEKGKPRFILLDKIGHAVIIDAVDSDIVRDLLLEAQR